MSTLVSKRGSLRIYLGYAAGVGKTYKMLEEAQEMKSRGVDVVIGYFEPHGRKGALELWPIRCAPLEDETFRESDAGNECLPSLGSEQGP